MFCKHCGTQFSERGMFCGSCGTKVNVAETKKSLNNKVSPQPTHKKLTFRWIVAILLLTLFGVFAWQMLGENSESVESILADAQTALESDEFIHNRGLIVESVSLCDTVSEESLFPSDNSIFNVSIEVIAKNESASFELLYDVLFGAGEDGWEMINIDLINRYATPLVHMPQYEVDTFVATLDFDSFSFIERTTDLSMFSDSDKLHYAATKQYHFLKETYELFVFPRFDVWEGQWNISRAEVREYVVKQEWNISGRWEFYRRGSISLSSVDFSLDIESFDGEILAGAYSFSLWGGGGATRNAQNSGSISINRDYFRDMAWAGIRRRDHYYVFWQGYPLLTIDRNEGLQLMMGGVHTLTRVR